MFVGEAPRPRRGLEGLPFVGRSGTLLDRISRRSADRIRHIAPTSFRGGRPATAAAAAGNAIFAAVHLQRQIGWSIPTCC